MRPLRICLVLVCMGLAMPAGEEEWTKHRLLAAQALKDKMFDVAVREAQAAFREALQFGPLDKRLGQAMAEYADVFAARKSFVDAAELYLRALEIYRSSGSDQNAIHHASTQYLVSVANGVRALYNRSNSGGEARVRQGLAMAANQNLHRPAATRLAATLGAQLMCDGYYQSAKRILSRAVALSEAPYALADLAEAERRMGFFAEAEEHLQKAITLDASATGSPTEEKSSVAFQRMYFMGLLYTGQGQYEVAEPILRQALDLKPPKDLAADIYRAIGNGYRGRKDFDKAAQAYRQAMDGYKETFPNEENRRRAELLADMGLSAFNQNDLPKAEMLLKESRGILEKVLRPGHPALADVLWHQALLLDAQKHPAEAETSLERALSILEKAAAGDVPVMTPILKDFAAIQKDAGHSAHAQASLARAARIPPKASQPAPSSGSFADEMEAIYWESISDLKDKSLFSQYLRNFPTGKHARQAEAVAGSRAAASEKPKCERQFDGLPVEQLTSCFASWNELGFAPSALAVYRQNGAVLASASFQRMGPRLINVMLKEADFRQAYELNRAHKYWPDVVSILITPQGPLFTATWAPAEGDFSMGIYSSAEQLRADFDKYHVKGLIPIVLAPLDELASRRFVVWEETHSTTDSRIFLDLTDKQGAESLQAQREAGFVPFRFATSGAGSARRHYNVWVSGPIVAWYRYTLPLSGFRTWRAELDARGFTLINLSSDGESFSGVWWRR